jgi:hypothetical protein
MSIGKTVAEKMSENGVPPAGEPVLELEPEKRRAIQVPPKAREELKALLRTQNEAQDRIRLVLATLEEALGVPPGWVIVNVDEGFVEVSAA